QLHAPVTTSLITMIQETTPKQGPCVIWITHQGMVHGTDIVQHTQTPWLECALLLTSSNDCLVIKNNPATQDCEIIMEGKHLTNLSADHALRLMRKALH